MKADYKSRVETIGIDGQKTKKKPDPQSHVAKVLTGKLSLTSARCERKTNQASWVFFGFSGVRTL